MLKSLKKHMQEMRRNNIEFVPDEYKALCWLNAGPLFSYIFCNSLPWLNAVVVYHVNHI